MKETRPYQTAYYESDWAFARAAYLAFETRMGKTFTELQAIKRRARERRVKRTLIVGPKYPLTMTWKDELGQTELDTFDLTQGTILKRAEKIIALTGDEFDGVASRVLLVNFEALDDYYEEIFPDATNGGYTFRKKWYESLAQARIGRERSNSKRIVDLLLDWKPEALIIDEAHLVSSAGAARSRALRRLGKQAAYRRLLSGTPDPRRAMSYYSQYVILDPDIFGTSKTNFVDTYFAPNPWNPYAAGELKGEKSEEFWAKVRSVMFLVHRSDYFGPQKPNDMTRELAWPSEIAATYKRLIEESVLASDDLTVDGTHKLTKILRCLQFCAGFLTDENSGTTKWLHRLKEEAIIADLSEPLALGERVVVSYQFTPAGKSLAQAIARVYGQKTVALCNHEAKGVVDYLRLFDVANVEETPLKVLVLQEQVGGVGISLARARHLFFHSWSMDAAAHAQMRARIWDSSAVSNITYYQMADCGKIESADRFARRIVDDKLDASIMKEWSIRFGKR